jgi:hypothetical protein
MRMITLHACVVIEAIREAALILLISKRWVSKKCVALRRKIATLKRTRQERQTMQALMAEVLPRNLLEAGVEGFIESEGRVESLDGL